MKKVNLPRNRSIILCKANKLKYFHFTHIEVIVYTRCRFLTTQTFQIKEENSNNSLFVEYCNRFNLGIILIAFRVLIRG